MLMSEDTRNRLNELLAACFTLNAFSDNIAYNLGIADYNNIENIYHTHWAHHFTEIADVLSGLMLKLDTRPIRLPVTGYDTDYNGNLVEMFADNLKAANEYRDNIVTVLEVAELNGDIEVKLALEDFLTAFIPYRKQAEVWHTYALRYQGSERSFEHRFAALSSLIAPGEEED